ncbi:MAG: ribosome maturation factor RimP [Deltaproteobacteria bacterium]|jgi:ribosome maturation factor RimP|nr:ribosome maturation factor RimP [Deltaproteobacteria bacterium]
MTPKPKTTKAKKTSPKKAPALGGESFFELGPKVKTLALSLVGPLGLELVNVEMTTDNGRRVLRVFVERVDSANQGVTLDELTSLSRRLSALLDEADEAIAAGAKDAGPAYTLEVSSPGLNRRLFREEDFRRFSGRLAKIKLPVDGKLRTVKGRLATKEGPFKLITESGEIPFEYGPDLLAALIPEI